MGQPVQPYANRGPVEITSISTALTFDPPIVWFQVITAGSGGLVVKTEDSAPHTYAGLIAGDTYVGPFRELTSMTVGKIRYGDGPPPPFAAGLAVAALYTDAQTTQGKISLSPQDFYLLTGAPLAIFANGASSVPGSAIVDSKAWAVRWNNAATLNGLISSFSLPPDVDTSHGMTLHVRASKTGATSGDATTFDVGIYNQVDAALDDADTNYGGTTSAMTGAATAKTIQNVTLAIANTDIANPQTLPVSVTITIKPTDGLLGTDDLCLLGVDIYYTRKLLPS